MGCDTSKESVQPAEEETKDEVKNGDIPKATRESTAKRDSPQPVGRELKEEAEAGKEEKQRQEAATRIQAVIRGHNVRKSMKDTESSGKQALNKSAIEQNQQECHAEKKENGEEMATKQVNVTESVADTTSKIGEVGCSTLNELDGIDLTDEKLNIAAAKIQGVFRDHLKRMEGTSKNSGYNNDNGK